MFDISGRNKKSDYVNVKIICATIEDVVSLVIEASEMERDN
jgi:hypothetical protein